MESDIDFLKGKNVLITGGGGYLGSKLAETLIHHDVNLSLMDIHFNNLAERLVESNANIKSYNSDITDKRAVENVCKESQPEYIYHFSALLNRDRDFNHYGKLYQVNVQGTLNLLESLSSINYKGFFFSSSSEVYGNKNQGLFHEAQIPYPPSPYSLTKLMAENLILSYSALYHKPFTILRIFNFFGLDMPENFFINQLIATLKRGDFFEMTGGDQIRDFLIIDEVLAAIIAISKSAINNGETINICSGKGISLKELAQNIASKLHKEHLLRIGAIPYRENEVWEMIGSNNKLKLSCPSITQSQLTEKLNLLFEN